LGLIEFVKICVKKGGEKKSNHMQQVSQTSTVDRNTSNNEGGFGLGSLFARRTFDLEREIAYIEELQQQEADRLLSLWDRRWQLRRKTLPELRSIAASFSINGRGKMRKAELIAAIEDTQGLSCGLDAGRADHRMATSDLKGRGGDKEMWELLVYTLLNSIITVKQNQIPYFKFSDVSVKKNKNKNRYFWSALHGQRSSTMNPAKQKN